ncbi:MAG: glutathione S-transferase family protein [Gammaproteobacteria bacterium]|nr:glutathione S-transferase family protein [Gammaproteobacteria bacterium]
MVVAIKLFEYGPTRSLKCRWALQEAGLDYESIGNSPEVLTLGELGNIHPLGKVPAILIDGKPLFESSAIVTAVADLVPALDLVAHHGTWERHIHDQWTAFAATELEIWAWCAMLNTREFLRSADKQVPEIVDQNRELFQRAAGALENVLGTQPYMMGESFSVTDIIVAYPLYLGQEVGFLKGFSMLEEYVQRLHSRPYCTFQL